MGRTLYEDETGTVKIKGSGENIWNEKDSFRMVYFEVTGDVELVVRLRAQQNVDEWAKAGLMIRNSKNPSAPNVALLMTPEKGLSFQSRDKFRASSKRHQKLDDIKKTPLFLKHWYLARVGHYYQ